MEQISAGMKTPSKELTLAMHKLRPRGADGPKDGVHLTPQTAEGWVEEGREKVREAEEKIEMLREELAEIEAKLSDLD
jgi:hypothetical protein